MSKISVHLIYESDIGQNLTAIRLSDPKAIRAVAKWGVEAAYQEAAAVGELDPFVGEVKLAEAVRLENVLSKLVPGLKEVKYDG